METHLFEARLESVGNPDHEQYAPVSDPCTLKARSLQELLVKIEAYRDENALGGGNWVDPKITCAGRVIGWVSYNGRLWDRPGDDPDWKKAVEIKFFDGGMKKGSKTPSGTPTSKLKDAPKTCGSCKRGEVRGVPATVMVSGKNRDGRHVVKAYLCDEHLEVEVQDGAEFKVVKLQTAYTLDELTTRNTGYLSFAQMCANYPTLRPINAEMRLLRAAYEKAVGKPAFA